MPRASASTCPTRIGSSTWIGNGVLDGFLEDESLFGEFLRTLVSEGGVEPPVIGPPHVVVEVMPQLPDRGVVVPVHELLPQQPVRRFDHGVVVGVALARQRSFDVEHVEQLVEPRVVEFAAPVRCGTPGRPSAGSRAWRTRPAPGPCPGPARRNVRRCPCPPGRPAGTRTPNPPPADADIGKIARRTRVRGVAVGPAVQ